jgi:hypothetical protein
MKKSIAPYRLGESVNEAESDILSLKNSLNITAMLNEINLDEKLREEGFVQFPQSFSKFIRSKWLLTIFVITVLVFILLVIAFCLFCKCYFRKSLGNRFWCYQRSLTGASMKESKVRALLSMSLLYIGDAAGQVPPPVPPRNHSYSFLNGR